MNTGCFKCDKAQWDADGCTCEITGLLVGDAARGCEYRKDTLEEQLKDWKEEFANLNKISYGFYKELKEVLELIREYKAENIAQKKMITEYKRLLKTAVEDFVRIDEVKLLPENTIRPMSEYTRIIDIIRHKWRYADEAEKLLNEEK